MISRHRRPTCSWAGDATKHSSLDLDALVLDTRRLIGVAPEAALAIFFVHPVIAFEPDDLAVAFEGQDVRGDAIEEPAIMADDHGATREIEHGGFQRAQRVDVQVV